MPPAPGAASLVEGYLSAALAAANQYVWGNLSCTVLLHPATQKLHGQAVQCALDDLRYGTICINSWTSVGFTVAQGHWGAYRGDTQSLEDAGSGLGVVHNTLMFDHSQKCVVWSPFVSLVHSLPERHLPLPMGVAKVVSGLLHSGVPGAIKLMRAE